MSESPKPKSRLQRFMRFLDLDGLLIKLLALVALSSAMASIVPFFTSDKAVDALGISEWSRASVIASRAAAEQAAKSQRIAELQMSQMQRIVSALTASGQNNTSSTQDRILASKIEELNRRERALEQVILANPAKALETPMLRNDLNNMKQTNADTAAALQHSVDRVYDQNKYVMLTIGISLALLALTTFVKAGKRD